MSLIVSLNLKDNIIIEIFQGSFSKYYRIIENQDDLLCINYDIHFPLEWALYKNSYLIYGEVYRPGPDTCKNCRFFGFHNGVFIGYCMNCAEVFNYKRGNGMTDLCKEVDENMVAFNLSKFRKENSMWNTYLKDINLNEIGDDKLKEEYELYKDLPDLIPMEEENNIESNDNEDEKEYELDSYYESDEHEKLELKKYKFMDNRRFDRY